MRKENSSLLVILILFTAGLFTTNFSNGQTKSTSKVEHNQVVGHIAFKNEINKKKPAIANTSNILNLSKENNADHCYQYNATYYATNKNVPSLYVVISRQMSDKITFSY